MFGEMPWVWLAVGSYLIVACLLQPLYKRTSKCIQVKLIEYHSMERN